MRSAHGNPGRSLASRSGIIAMVATCATCCIAAIPYLGTVILLPLLVFIRCYSLCFLEQLGPDWQFFARPVPEIAAPSAP